jgi:DNA-binding IclR family transcriptional regulator
MTMTNPNEEGARRHLAELRIDLEARAAGYWWHAGDWLEQVAFVASRALAADVIAGFAEATRSVPLSQTELGIVRAALSGEPTVSRVSELSEGDGSGYWLRAFGAVRSVAVPLRDPKGEVRAIVSVALADEALGDDDVVARIHAVARWWAHFG